MRGHRPAKKLYFNWRHQHGVPGHRRAAPLNYGLVARQPTARPRSNALIGRRCPALNRQAARVSPDARSNCIASSAWRELSRQACFSAAVFGVCAPSTHAKKQLAPAANLRGYAIRHAPQLATRAKPLFSFTRAIKRPGVGVSWPFAVKQSKKGAHPNDLPRRNPAQRPVRATVRIAANAALLSQRSRAVWLGDKHRRSVRDQRQAPRHRSPESRTSAIGRRCRRPVRRYRP